MSRKIKLKIKIGPLEDDSQGLIHREIFNKMGLEIGDILFIEHRCWIYGGLRSAKVRAGRPFDDEKLKDYILLSRRKVEEGYFAEGDMVKIEKLL